MEKTLDKKGLLVNTFVLSKNKNVCTRFDDMAMISDNKRQHRQTAATVRSFLTYFDFSRSLRLPRGSISACSSQRNSISPQTS